MWDVHAEANSSEKTVKNKIINTSVSETELNSCASVFQEMLNEVKKQLNESSKINQSSESTINQEQNLGSLHFGGKGNTVAVKQEASSENNTSANVVASMMCSNDFTIQQKFLMARATELTNDNVAAFANSQVAGSEATSSDGSNPNSLCSQQKSSFWDIFKLGKASACVSQVKELIENSTENSVKNYLSKFSSEETTISQKNIDETYANIESCINSSNLSSINQILKIDMFVIDNDSENNNIEISQKATIVNKIKSEIESEIVSKGRAVSDSDTTNTKTETTKNSSSTTATNSQTATITTKVSNVTLIVIIVAVVLAIALIAVVFIVFKLKNKAGNAGTVAVGNLLNYCNSNPLLDSLNDSGNVDAHEKFISDKLDNNQITTDEWSTANSIIRKIKKDGVGSYFGNLSEEIKEVQFLQKNDWILNDSDQYRISEAKQKEIDQEQKAMSSLKRSSSEQDLINFVEKNDKMKQLSKNLI